MQSRWTRSDVGVAEAILAGTSPTVSAIHEATGLSVGACTKALRILTVSNLLRADAARGPRSGRRVIDSNALLDAYVDAAFRLRSDPTVRVGMVGGDPIEELIAIGQRWDEAGPAWAATGLAAAMVVAPLVTSIGSAEVYVGSRSVPQLEAMASQHGLRVMKGGRLALAPFPTATTRKMATTAHGLRVAPWPRLVADLRRSGVRGEEAAEHLVKVMQRE